jgi:hypothetical protein
MSLRLCIITSIFWTLPAVVVSARQMVADATEHDYEILSFSNDIGAVRANSEICSARGGVHSMQVLDVLANASFVAKARYRQLGLNDDDELEDEHAGQQEARVRHKQNPLLPDCKLFDREVDALIWTTANQGVDFIRRFQQKSRP